MTDPGASDDGQGTDADDGATFEPTDPQKAVIGSNAYPMRVMAGAGTGKTFTMVRKIRALLDDGVSPEEILALTFTNKAADSIRQKLVEEIGAPGNDVDAYTYHSIGETILRDRPYEVGLDPRYEIATEVDQLELIYESLDDIHYQFTKPRVAAPDESGSGVAEKLATFVPQMKGEGFDPEEIRSYLGEADRLLHLEGMTNHLEDRAAELFDFGQWRKPNPDRLAEDMIAPLRTFQDELELARSDLHTEGLERDVGQYLLTLEALCESLIDLFERRQDEILDGGPLEPTFRLPALLFGAKYTRKLDATGLPRLDKTPLGRLRETIEACQTASDLTEGYVAYDRKLRDANLVDFGDLVARSRGLLTDPSPDAPEGSGTNSWNYVFCDEFQDTDTIQFDLVAELVGEENLFVVGDIYQAIYEWRGANIDNIENRLQDHFQPTDLPLSDNFRSNRPILELANDALTELPGHETSSRLDPGTAEQEVDRGVVTIDAPEADSYQKTIDEDGEAVYIAEGIRKLLQGDTDLVHEDDLDRLEDDDRPDPDSYRPEDIAILVRAKRHARPIIRQLEQRGIPYSLGGSLAADSIGVRTVIAYLKVLSDPGRDDSLNRVLTMRYRLHDSDLKALNQRSGELADTLLEANYDPEQLREPDRVEQARADLEYLLSIRDSRSLVGLYDELKDRTDIERFLSQRDRTGLEHLDTVIQEYGRERVQPELSEAFIEFLQYNATTVLEGAGGVQDQPDKTEGAVNIMTVHKSKGLEFPVVFLPRLSADGWDPRQQSNAGLRHALGESAATPFDPELFRRDEFEQRRAFHVAVTRAQFLCVLSGRTKSSDDDDDDELTRATLAELLPPEMEWCAYRNRFPVWETVQRSLPASETNWTAGLRDSLTGADHTMVRTAAGGAVSLTDAYEAIIDAAQAAVDGTGTAIDPSEFDLPTTPVEPAPVDLLTTHSYTSIRTFDQCPYRHYLSYVVNAIDDPDPSLLGDGFEYTVGTDHESTGGSSDVPMREVGTLFHWVAERADQRTYATSTERRARWKELVSERGGYSDAVKEKVLACIDVFFSIDEATSWTVLSTERWFDLTYDGHRIVGQIDAVCENDDGEKIIVDYKTGRKKRPEDKQYQLPIYLHAANDRGMIGDVNKAVYVYVNDDLETENRIVERSADDEWVAQRMGAISATIEKLERTTYQTAEPHATPLCYECTHRSLPCSREFDKGSDS